MSEELHHNGLSMLHACRVALTVLLMASLCSSFLHAADGNVKGKVVDLKSGEPLIGANIMVVGSARGGVANDKGEYFISGIPPGVYTIRATFIGYHSVELKKVEISSNQTVVLDFKMTSSDLEVEGVTILGQAPLVDVMKTSGEYGCHCSAGISRVPPSGPAQPVMVLPA